MLTTRIDRWLLAPGPSHLLAYVRTALAIVIGLRIATGPYGDFAGQPDALFRPPLFLSWVPSMPSEPVFVALQVVGIAFVLMTVWQKRPELGFVGAWLALLVLAGFRGSLGKILHNDVLLLLACVPIVFSPCGARLSKRSVSPNWGWPIRAATVMIVLVYFLTGAQKLRHSGLDWVFSDNMRWILYSAASGDMAPTDAIARFIADRAWLATVTAGGLLFTELVAPLVLFWRRFAIPYVLMAAGLHLGTWLTLGLDYWAWVLTVAIVLPAYWQLGRERTVL